MYSGVQLSIIRSVLNEFVLAWRVLCRLVLFFLSPFFCFSCIAAHPQVEDADVYGSFDGSLESTSKVSLRSTGNILGSVVYRRMVRSRCLCYFLDRGMPERVATGAFL